VATLNIFKRRTNTIRFRLGADYSADTLSSDIRVSKDDESELIVSWTIIPEPATDPEDGIYLFSIDDALLPSDIVDKGWMDIKRVSGGEPVPGPFDKPLQVKFVEVVTE